MIFSRFFTPDHAKPDPKIRKAAAEKLSPEEPKSKQILHELAFNDEAPEVNLAALTQLNSFPLWQKMAQIAKNDRVKKAAANAVKQAVLTPDNLPADERTQFLLESADAELVKQAVEHDIGLLEDADMAIRLLHKINRPQVVESIFARRAGLDLQQKLLDQESDVSVLARWAKKTQGKPITEHIQARLQQLEHEKQRPVKLAQSLTMVLSKLLALSESQDYPYILEQRAELQREYDALEQDFAVFKNRERDAYVDKKASIDNKLDALLARLKEPYETQRIEQEKQRVVATLQQQLSDAQQTVSNLFASLTSATLAEFEHAQTQLQTLQQQLNEQSSLIGRALSEPMLQTLGELDSTLSRVPEWQRHTQSMTDVLDGLSEQVEALLPNPEQIPDQLKTLQEKFYAVFDTASPLATSQKKAWNTLKRKADSAYRGFSDQAKKESAQLRKTLNMIASLIAQGKYRAAMSKYSAFNETWSDAADTLKSAVQRKYDEVSSEVERLAGWQSYLAAPRKPSLLDEAKALISDAELPMPQRAEKIKLLRRQWQSLSVTTDEVDEHETALNKAFDEALEAAFVPCRNYFAEQEAKRNTALRQRQALLSQLQALAEQNEHADGVLLSAFDDVQKQWRDSAPLPQTDYKSLKQQYDELRDKVSQKLAGYLSANKSAKEALIAKSQTLLQSEHEADTIDMAKALQQQWKSIDSAGHRLDGKLWKAFRAVHNDIFERAKQQGLARQQAFNQHLQDVTEQVDGFIEKQDRMTDADYQTGLSELETALQPLPKGVSASLKKRLEQVAVQRQRAKADEAKAHRQQQADTLALVLDTLIETGALPDALSDVFVALPKPWQQALLNADKAEQDLADLLVTLEIVCGIDSPSDCSETRTTLQMKLLSDSFNQGASPQPRDVLLTVLANTTKGVLQQQDVVRINQCVAASFVAPAAD